MLLNLTVFFPGEESSIVLGFSGTGERLGNHRACGCCHEGYGMGHGVAVSPEVAKRMLWACLTMPAAALAVRLYVDPVHQAQTHHAVELPMPPHVPPPVADLTEQQQQSTADSS